jgi:uncharacterized protein (DUF1330 family)
MKLALAMRGSAALGAAAVQTLHAQAKPPAYVIGEITVKNQDGYMKEFVPATIKAIQAAGGKLLVRGGKTVSFDGAAPSARVVIIQYENMDAAQAWWNSQAAKDAYAIGQKYADFRLFAAEGVAP